MTRGAFFYYFSYIYSSHFIFLMDNKKVEDTKPRKPSNVYEYRFEKLMMLMRMDRMLKTAVIRHKKIEQ